MGTTVAKEEISALHIVPAFVDNTARWQKDLGYAARLGNEHKGKTSITFETTTGPRTVETTVWSVTEEGLQLKGGTFIPLRSIIEIHY